MARADRRAGDSLGLRVLSALILAPIAAAAAWLGSPYLLMVTAVAGASMAWEWARLCCGDRLRPSGLMLIGAVLAAIASEAASGVAPAIGIAILGAAAVFLFAHRQREREASWLALGAAWLAIPCVLLLWLARPDDIGSRTVLWIFVVVWATDIGAYLVGRRVGGPLLAPRWSPRKTWAGLIGGAGCAALAGWGTARVIDGSVLLPLVSAGLAIVGQFGDLAESLAKRRFGVKDSSGLIPGHGGVLDRLDGLLAVVPAVALLTLIGGSVLAWR